MKTECGIFGIVYKEKNRNTICKTISGLELLQHRGRESAGITYQYNDNLITYKDSGLVKKVFQDFDKKVETNICIGHVRYSTSGDKNMEKYIQPVVFDLNNKQLSLVFNGNIKNINRSKEKFGLSNISMDTEMIVEIIKKIDKPSIEEKLTEFIEHVNGVYCIVILDKDGLYVLRDSYGVRPLCIGQNKDGYCISSESCALQEFNFVREVKSGEILFIKDKIVPIYLKKENILSKCIFEHIYFMNKDSRLDFKKIEEIRYNVGKEIAREDIEFSKEDSLVTGCPQTGIPYGRGYSVVSGLEYAQFLRKKDNTGRTFILPENEMRIISCKKNLYIDGEIKGKNLILLDDSLVRGNTMTAIIQKLRESGAKSVHVRITSPPVKSPCYFGVDIPSYDELIASTNTVEQIRQIIGADTLKYTELDKIKKEIGESENSFCGACFNGNYNEKLLEW
jgi:amidophosphoribosyltransferase